MPTLIKIATAFFLICSSAFAGSTVVVVGQPTGAAPAFTGVFYSDFEDAADDATWGTLPTGWNDDYTTTALEGSESCLTDATAWDAHASDNFTAQSSGTTYARTSFRATSSGTATEWGVYLELRDNSTGKAACFLNYVNGSGFESVGATDASTNTSAYFSGTAFTDATYFLEMTYVRGTSISCRIVQSDGATTWGSASATHSTSSNQSINNILVSTGACGVPFIFDKVEVRSDTNWGE